MALQKNSRTCLKSVNHRYRGHVGVKMRPRRRRKMPGLQLCCSLAPDHGAGNQGPRLVQADIGYRLKWFRFVVFGFSS